MRLMPGQAVAIFDIGSNAVRLTGYRLNADGRTEQILKKRELCEMARPHDRAHYLYPPGVAWAHKTIAQYCDLVRDPKFAFTGVVAVATEAVRRALDGPDFTAKVRNDTGLNIHVLSENEEGIFGARGVLRDIPDADGLVADLGGGSMQLTRVQEGQTFDTQSFPLGGLRLLGARDHLHDYIEAHLRDLIKSLHSARTLYVVGSWRAFADLYQQRAGIRERNLHGVIMSPDRVAALTDWLFHDSPDVLQKILTDDYGFESSRAELLPLGGYLLRHLITMLAVSDVIVSSSGIRDGILEAIINGQIDMTPLPVASARQTA